MPTKTRVEQQRGRYAPPDLEPSQVADHLQHLVGRLDDLRVQFEMALRGNQVHQLLDGFDVRGLQELLSKNAQTVAARITGNRRAGGDGFGVKVLAYGQEPLGIDEPHELNGCQGAQGAGVG